MICFFFFFFKIFAAVLWLFFVWCCRWLPCSSIHCSLDCLYRARCKSVFSWIYAFREQRKLRCEKTNKNTIFFISNWTNEKKNNFLKNQTALKRSAWLLYSIPSVLWYFCDANKRKATCLWNFWNVKPSPMCQWVNVFQCV